MALSLRTRLTVWSSALLLLTIVLFTATVLWLHWRLLARGADAALDALSVTAVNVVAGELVEHATLAEATHEVESVVRRAGYLGTVFDGRGVPVGRTSPALPIDPTEMLRGAGVAMKTVAAPDGQEWRGALRSGQATGARFTVTVAAPVTAITRQWRALLEACAVGITFVGAVAVPRRGVLGHTAVRPPGAGARA